MPVSEPARAATGPAPPPGRLSRATTGKVPSLKTLITACLLPAPTEGIGMGILKPLKKLVEGGHVQEGEYLDLGEMTFEEDVALGNPAKCLVRVAEIYRYEDVADLATQVYNGNIMVLDYSALANDELSLKRITGDLKAQARDINGDVAALGKNLLMATPTGIKIDRNKIKGAF